MGKLTVALALAAVALVAAPERPAESAEPSVRLGEVSAPDAVAGVDLDALRAIATDALASLDGRALPPNPRAVLSVALVRLDSHPGGAPGGSAEVSCQVSATLRDAARGTVFAILEGKARGQDEPKRLAALERATLRAAVGSAVSRVPEALRRKR